MTAFAPQLAGCDVVSTGDSFSSHYTLSLAGSLFIFYLILRLAVSNLCCFKLLLLGLRGEVCMTAKYYGECRAAS